MASKRRQGRADTAKSGFGTTAVAERQKTVGNNLSFGASEAYKLLRTNLVFSLAAEEGCKVIGVTSAIRREGKSTTSVNLAYTMAQTGKRVLLLEADMRIPVMSGVLNLGNVKGLSHVLVGISSLNEAVHHTSLIDNLLVLPAGEIPPNPAELLSSKRMEQVVTALASSFDYIIFDLPPVNAVSDGLAVSKLLSGMIVVVRQEYCDQADLAEAMRRMELTEVKVLGFVLNDSEADDKRYKKYGKYKSGYTYGYGQKTEEIAPSTHTSAI